MSNCAAPRCALRLSFRAWRISVSSRLLLVIFRLVLALLLPAMQLLLQSLWILQNACACGMLVRIDSRCMLVHLSACWTSAGESGCILARQGAWYLPPFTTSAESCYTQPCCILCLASLNQTAAPHHTISHLITFASIAPATISKRSSLVHFTSGCNRDVLAMLYSVAPYFTTLWSTIVKQVLTPVLAYCCYS